MDRNAIDRFADNPFFVLGLSPSCARAEIEREGRRLLAMLELELSAALTYETPVGERQRHRASVRPTTDGPRMAGSRSHPAGTVCA